MCSVPAPTRPSHLPLTHRRGGGGRLQQLVPVLFADQTACQHVVPIARHQGRPALAAHEALEMEHVEGGAGLVRRRSSRFHDELAGGDGLSARRTRSRISEQPAGTIRTLAPLNFYFRIGGAGGGLGVAGNGQRIALRSVVRNGAHS